MMLVFDNSFTVFKFCEKLLFFTKIKNGIILLGFKLSKLALTKFISVSFSEKQITMFLPSDLSVSFSFFSHWISVIFSSINSPEKYKYSLLSFKSIIFLNSYLLGESSNTDLIINLFISEEVSPHNRIFTLLDSYSSFPIF